MIKFQKILTLSNLLSFLRLLISIPVYFLFEKLQQGTGYRIILLSLLLFATATDFFDGYFARKFNQITEFGKLIDPLADKIIIAVIMVRLFSLELIPGYYFYLVIGRDILILTGGIIISNKLGKVLSSNLLGKITVTFIGFYIIGIVLNLENNLYWLHNLLLYSSLTLIFTSMLGYIVRAKELLTWNKNESV
ncbi:MAG: CDP-alcohol phosphatidyltransferase family protein [Ignavibacteria bacterium]